MEDLPNLNNLIFRNLNRVSKLLPYVLPVAGPYLSSTTLCVFAWSVHNELVCVRDYATGAFQSAWFGIYG